MDADFGTDSGTHELSASEERSKSFIRQLEAEMEPQKKRPKRKIVTWAERDSMVEACVEFGLNQMQISEFAHSWIQPITTVQQVSDKIIGLHLKTLYDRRSRKRIGHHNRTINKLFIKIAGQIMQRGWAVENIAREKAVFDGFAVRPDFYFEAVKGKRLLLPFEHQGSKTTFTIWGRKLMQYVRVYESGIRIRVYITVHSPDEMTRARSEARRILKATGHEGLNLFLFALADEVEVTFNDVVTAPVWKSAWGDQKPWILLG